MSRILISYISEIDNARKDLNRFKGKQLHSKKARDGLRELVEKYFNDVRPAVISNREQNEEMRKADSDMQEMLVLCHKRGSIKRYKQLLTEVKNLLILVDSQIISSFSLQTNSGKLDSVDSQIINTIQAMIPSAALSFHQAINDLRSDDRLSWRGPATDLREALREVLDHLAPDNEVKSMADYKQDKDISGPTMKQKVQFILKNRGVPKAASGSAVAATNTIDEMLGTFVRFVYTRTNVSTHTPTDKNEVLRILGLTRVVLCELLEIRNEP